MAYCSNCGRKIEENVNFCAGCGAPVSNVQENSPKRTMIYEGELHKCPNCGEILDSFMAKCPGCGYEIRGAKTTSSVREFAHKLEEIEKERTDGKKSLLGIRQKMKDQININAIDEKKISLIRSFSIPNTKEDLTEFFIMAASNINANRHNQFNELSESQKAVSDAWQAKFEQAYEKAKLSFGNTAEFAKIQSLYNQKNKEIKKGKNLGILILVALILFLLSAGLVSFIGLERSNNADYAKIEAENARLQAIVEEVYDALENENYVLARAKATTLVFIDTTTLTAGNEAVEQWEKTRESLIELIDEAESGKK